MSTELPARLTSLAAIEAEVWRQLALAVTEPLHEWRTPVLATTDGGFGDARSVVLREVDSGARSMLLYSDARTAKVAQIASHPHGTLLMWSRHLGWQLRCRVALSVETTGLALTSRWARIKLTRAANDYLSALPPGASLDPSRPAAPDRTARAHFALITARTAVIDWLELHADGHRRARFTGADATWLQA